MSDSQSARLGLPYLAAGQMQKHVTLNEALTRLDVLVQTRIESRGEADPPDTPEDGALYLVGEDATGAWAGFEAGRLVRFELGGWSTVQLAPGHLAIIADEDVAVVWDGADWSPLGLHLGEIGGLARLGINTDADADNPLAAKLNKALLTAVPPEDGGDGFGHAVDLAPYPLDWEGPARFPKFDAIARAMLAAANDLGVAIRWGADWDRDGKPRERGESDSPHFELAQQETAK